MKTVSGILGLSLLVVSSVAFAQLLNGSSPVANVPSQTTCPKTINGYKAGKANAAFVKKCLGKPDYEDHNPDGRFVYEYDVPKGDMTAFLFDPNSMLVRVRVYGHK